jgi:hypothetical protein
MDFHGSWAFSAAGWLIVPGRGGPANFPATRKGRPWLACCGYGILEAIQPLCNGPPWRWRGGLLDSLTMNAHRPAPEALALLICDQIITDRMTGKQSLIGMFSVIHAMKFPVTHPQLSVFASLTGGHGEVGLTIRIVDSNEARKPLVEGNGKVRFSSPLAIANLALQFHGLTFVEPGEYRVQLLSEGALIREARLRLLQARPRRPEPDPGIEPSGGPEDFMPGLDQPEA